jgi:hypothetical protein
MVSPAVPSKANFFEGGPFGLEGRIQPARRVVSISKAFYDLVLLAVRLKAKFFEK